MRKLDKLLTNVAGNDRELLSELSGGKKCSLYFILKFDILPYGVVYSRLVWQISTTPCRYGTPLPNYPWIHTSKIYQLWSARGDFSGAAPHVSVAFSLNIFNKNAYEPKYIISWKKYLDCWIYVIVKIIYVNVNKKVEQKAPRYTTSFFTLQPYR